MVNADGRITVRDLAEGYIAQIHGDGMKSAPRVASVLERHILPVFALRKAEEVTRAELWDWFKQLEERAPPAAANQALFAARRMYEFGVRRGWLSENPLDHFPAPVRRRVRDVHLPVEQLCGVITELAMEPYWAAAALLMLLLSACRTSDFLVSRRENIRPEHGGYLALGHFTSRLARPGDHLVPITPLMHALLEKQIALQPNSPFLFGADTNPMSARGTSELRKRWKAVQMRAGVADPTTLRDIRRTAAWVLMLLGTDRRVLEKILALERATMPPLRKGLPGWTSLEECRAALEAFEAFLLGHPEIKAAVAVILAKKE